ncbi:MAG: nitrate reductase molybdenum cofactor assembly chaperone [Anaeromyxobacteraceae bacterium]
MSPRPVSNRALGAFAELLTYPVRDPADVARECLGLVARPEATRRLERFATVAAAAGPHELEERYSEAFDLDPACPPYLGHHLCGESPRRGAFMARLAGVYRDDGFADDSGELPDHLAVVLRYLAAVPAGASRDALLADALRPALDRMAESLRESSNPYASVIDALREEVSP